MKIEIRRARHEEKDRLFALYESAMRGYIQTVWGWDEDWQRNDFEQAFAATETHIVKVDSQFAGYFQLDLISNALYLRMLILDPAYRSQGVGKHLLERLVLRAEVEGRKLVLCVFKINTSAMKFYQKNGWVVKAEEPAFFVMEYVAPGERQSNSPVSALL